MSLKTQQEITNNVNAVTSFFNLDDERAKTAYIIADIANRAVKREAEQPGQPMVKLDADCMRLLGSLCLKKKQLCALLGISYSTLEKACERDEEVMKAYEQGRMMTLAHVGQSVIAQALNGDVKAAMFVLETQAKWKKEDDEAQKGNGVSINFNLELENETRKD